MRKTFRQTGGKGRWSDPNNWSPAGVPSANDDVTINNKVVIDCIAEAKHLTVSKDSMVVWSPLFGSLTIRK